MGSLSYVLAGVVLAALATGGACIPKVPPGPNVTANYNGQWLNAMATWYGKPTGAGPKDNGNYSRTRARSRPVQISYYYLSCNVVLRNVCSIGRTRVYVTGGACGIKDVNLPPYSAMTACGNVPIFKDGRGCGSCYEVPVTHISILFVIRRLQLWGCLVATPKKNCLA